MDEDIVVPFFLFATIAVTFWGGFKYSAVKRNATLETVRAVVEKTGDASPALIKAIGADSPRQDEDLRKGMLLLAITAAIVGVGVFVADDMSDVGIGIALFPGLIGAVYMAFHFMNSGKADPMA